jgi:hypothetical protein
MNIRHGSWKLTLSVCILGMVCVAGGVALGQENYPNPALSMARSAGLRNGGIESEWEYHRRASSPKFTTQFTPLSKYAGGVGYCCPTMVAPYYGCDRSSRDCQAGCR